MILQTNTKHQPSSLKQGEKLQSNKVYLKRSHKYYFLGTALLVGLPLLSIAGTGQEDTQSDLSIAQLFFIVVGVALFISLCIIIGVSIAKKDEDGNIEVERISTKPGFHSSSTNIPDSPWIGGDFNL